MPVQFHKEILTPQATKLFPRLRSVPNFENFYLVGGTALSLYLGHRESVDFDFFTKQSFKATYLSEFKKISKQNLQVLIRNDSSLEFVLDGVKIFLWENHYPLVEPLGQLGGFNIASKLDIGLLKLIAIDGRTTWKDVVDLYFFDKKVIPLEQLIEKYHEIYPSDTENLYQSIMTHLHFDEINKSPKPNMLVDVDFDEVFLTISSKLISSIRLVI